MRISSLGDGKTDSRVFRPSLGVVRSVAFLPGRRPGRLGNCRVVRAATSRISSRSSSIRCGDLRVRALGGSDDGQIGGGLLDDSLDQHAMSGQVPRRTNQLIPQGLDARLSGVQFLINTHDSLRPPRRVVSRGGEFPSRCQTPIYRRAGIAPFAARSCARVSHWLRRRAASTGVLP
jgi:hypothetical protein